MKEEKILTLKKREDFLKVRHNGNSVYCQSFILQSMERPSSSHEKIDARSIRVGYVASKKVGNAVLRNRAKRRLRAIVKDIVPSHSKPGIDYVIIAVKRTIDCPFTMMKKNLVRGLKKLS